MNPSERQTLPDIAAEARQDLIEGCDALLVVAQVLRRFAAAGHMAEAKACIDKARNALHAIAMNVDFIERTEP